MVSDRRLILNIMGARTTDELIELAYERLEGLDAALKRIPKHQPTWRTLWHEYVDLYNEVANKDFDKLRTRFQGV